MGAATRPDAPFATGQAGRKYSQSKMLFTSYLQRPRAEMPMPGASHIESRNADHASRAPQPTMLRLFAEELELGPPIGAISQE